MNLRTIRALLKAFAKPVALLSPFALLAPAWAEDASAASSPSSSFRGPFFDCIADEATRGRTLYLLAGLFLTTTLLQITKSPGVQRIRRFVLLFLFHLLFLPITGYLKASGSTLFAEAQFLSLLLAAMAGIFMIETLFFDVIMPWIHVHAPRLLRDLILAISTVAAAVYVLAYVGAPLDKVFTTSAIVTAVIGFSLQDTLGNIMGGLSLQLDNSIAVGDWIKVNDPATPINGRVVMIRWRYTAVETRNWETIIVPNSILMKGQVLVLGRRTGKPHQWRRWVYFNVDFRHAPSEVIGVVENALRAAPLERVAADPVPNCICVDLMESYARYAVRYWLTDLSTDDPTDSTVRCRIYFALKRSNIPLSIPAHAIFTTKDSSIKRRREKEEHEIEVRRKALAGVDLFNHMTEQERAELANALEYTPFAKNEILTHQGSLAHWLYIIIKGDVSIRVSAEGAEREVSKLTSGHFFGEMALMTGAPRVATVVALTDVECYRLDKDAFQSVISKRPELAHEVADILANRRVELEAVKENLSEEAKKKRIETAKTDLVDSIKKFFGLNGDDEEEAA